MKYKPNAIYPLSANPIHNGHLYNLEASVRTGLFDKIFVGIGINPAKDYIFSLAERELLAKKAIATLGYDNVVVESFSGLLGHYAYSRGAQVVIRGARNEEDFTYEKSMSEYNSKFGLTTFIIPSKEGLNISSTFIREVARNGGLVDGYAHPAVKQALEERLRGVSIVGVTGNMGSGKSTFCQGLEAYGRSIGYPIKHFDADKVTHALFREGPEANPLLYQQMKEAFGSEICSADRINRKMLSEIVFCDASKMKELSRILSVPFKIEFEKAIMQNKGILLLDAAYLVEYSMLDWVNCNMILVNCDESERRRRVMARDAIDIAEFDKRAKFQLPNVALKKVIVEEQSKQGYGLFIEANSLAPDYQTIVEQLKSNFPMFKKGDG